MPVWAQWGSPSQAVGRERGGPGRVARMQGINEALKNSRSTGRGVQYDSISGCRCCVYTRPIAVYRHASSAWKHVQFSSRCSCSRSIRGWLGGCSCEPHWEAERGSRCSAWGLLPRTQNPSHGLPPVPRLSQTPSHSEKRHVTRLDQGQGSPGAPQNKLTAPGPWSSGGLLSQPGSPMSNSSQPSPFRSGRKARSWPRREP